VVVVVLCAQYYEKLLTSISEAIGSRQVGRIGLERLGDLFLVDGTCVGGVRAGWNLFVDVHC
jgi:hypothetical protein